MAESGRRLLLHACCGPCSLEPTRLLQQEGWDITICYVNPNIAPRSEYDHRLETLRFWAGGEGISVLEGPYDAAAWERDVARFGTNRAARCTACYRMRLRVAADMGAAGGFDALATTLAVSPYQLLDACNRELEREARRVGLEPLPRDFTAWYPQATTRSRELGMYRQNYCGCRFSAAESAWERCEAREARTRDRDVVRAAAAGAR
ncbi:MAG: epoxyqueuosine reductase QueH [Coriobacteriia bacterium]|nr:epoxyqueuosine reductase QueH [Coriobacteriia bacterium]MBS5478938.1 epoxyqueuosine reductase QueH [Coriobacteriia bacterium]